MSLNVENKLQLAKSICKDLNGIEISPTNGHFAHLVELSYPIFFDKEVSEEDIVEKKLDEAINATYASGSSYYKQMEDFSALYVKPLVKRFDMLRRKIIPFVSDMVVHANENYKKEFTLQPDVRNVIVPEIYHSEGFLKTLSGHGLFSSVSNKTIELIGGFQPREEEEILKVMTSGSTIIDDMLVDMIASYPKGWLKEVYDDCFVDGRIFATTIPAETIIHHVDRAIVCYFILGHHIANDIVDPNVNMKLDDYNKMVSTTFNNLGGFIHKYISILYSRIDSGEIVYNYDRNENVVYVFQQQYEKYLSKGGDVDAMLGVLLDNDTAYILPTLENKTRYAAAYVEHYNKQISEKEARFRNQVVGSFADAFKAAYANLDNETKCFLCSVDQEITVAPEIEQLDHYIPAFVDNLNATASNNPFDIYIYAILNTGLSKAHRFNDLYRRISELSENMDPSVAAFRVAMVDVVGALLDSCITIVKK